MRFFLLLLILGFQAGAQPVTSKVADIAAMERKAHERYFINDINSVASANFDIHYMRTRWEVDPAVRQIKGSVTYYFKAVGNITSITLDLMQMLVTDSVKRNNVHLNYAQSSNSLIIDFPITIPGGTTDSIEIFYNGIPPNNGFGSFTTTTHAGIPVMWTLSEPYGSRDWFPCKNGLDDKIDSIDIFIIHPAAYKAASNGLLQSETDFDAGRKITWWKHRYPIATYLVCFAVTNYAVFTNSVMLGPVNLPMVTYCYPESLTVFQGNVQKVLNALQLFHAHFGDYPFKQEKYGHVQFSWGGGMEHQTSTFISSSEEGLMAHELGHQWFGDKITCGSWEDIWLNEGFATHLASFYTETNYPANTRSNRASVLQNITSQPGGSVKVDDTTSVNRIFSNRLTYNKGSYLVYMLRLTLGDSVFFRGIRRYQDDPAIKYGFARTADLKRNLEQESGQDLTQFFTQWFEGQGYPSYYVQWNLVGSGSVQIKLSQTTSHSSVPFFQMPVPLLFKNSTQEKLVTVDNTINDEVFLRSLGFIPDTVLVDPDLWMITRNNTSEKIVIPAGTPGVEINPNPINGPVTIYIHDMPDAKAQIQLFNMAGQRILKKTIPLFNGSEITTLDFSTLAKGVYIIEVTSGGFRLIKQLIR